MTDEKTGIPASNREYPAWHRDIGCRKTSINVRLTSVETFASSPLIWTIFRVLEWWIRMFDIQFCPQLSSWTNFLAINIAAFKKLGALFQRDWLILILVSCFLSGDTLPQFQFLWESEIRQPLGPIAILWFFTMAWMMWPSGPQFPACGVTNKEKIENFHTDSNFWIIEK